MIHNSQANPIDVSNRRRHQLLQYDHNPPHTHTRHTITTQLRCAPCHHKRHQVAGPPSGHDTHH